MTNSKVERVLGRQGAHELTPQEVEQVTGGAKSAFNTTLCTSAVATTTGDGDGCTDHDVY